MIGEVGILNVGAGDVKLTFDNTNPAETIRAARICKDMIRRGFALLVEVERDGEKRFERALDFNEKNNSYIIADFDPVQAESVDRLTEEEHVTESQGAAAGAESSAEPTAEDSRGPAKGKGTRRGGRGGRREVAADEVRAVAVGRSAGG